MQPTVQPNKPLLIANLIAQIAFGLLAMTICLPSMQDWGEIFGVEQAAVQLTFSGYVVAYGVVQLVYGPLSDRYGRKRILLVGLGIAAVGSFLAALATELETLVAARVLQGAGSAAGMVVARASVQDLFHGAERTRVMAYVGMVLGLCPPFATIVGGQIHVLVGWQGNFVLMGVLAIGLLVAGARWLPARSARPEAGSHWLREMGRAYSVLMRTPAYLMYVVILACSTAAFYSFLSGAPIVLETYGIGPAGIGWYIMVIPLSYIVGNWVTSSVAHRMGERRIMATGQGLTIAGLILMLALGIAGLRTPLAFALPLMLLGFGHGFLMPASLVGTVGLVPALAGSAAAFAGLMQQLLGAIGGYVVGLVPHDGSVNLGLVMMGFTLFATAAMVVLHRRR